MNDVISNIIDAFPNCEVSLNELGDAPTFWKRWKDTVIGIAFGFGSIITSIAIHLVNISAK